MRYPNKKAIVGKFTTAQATKIPNSKGIKERNFQIATFHIKGANPLVIHPPLEG